MLRATDLVYENERLKKLYEANYKREFEKCIHEIKRSNKELRLQEVWYNVPIYIMDNPNYNHVDCIEYIKTRLEHNDFLVESKSNKLYISWKKEDVEKKKKPPPMPLPIVNTLSWQPSSAISELRLKTVLMKNNPKYAHLKSIKKKT
jgi:hypothetical protein